jgi:hypothetical protein
MDITGVVGIAIKCWLAWISVSYIANFLKLTHRPLLECYPYEVDVRWKSITKNLVFYFVLSLVIVAVHVGIWSSTGLSESKYIAKFALIVALCHGALASYLVLRNRKREDRRPMAAVVLYWHLLCGLYVALVIEMEIMERWLFS